MNRRNFMVAAGASVALAAPVRLFAQVAPSLRDRRILDLARQQVEKAGSVLWRRDIAGIADFGVHSANKRFHFANLENGTVRSFFVTHGMGSDPDHDGWLNSYSNVPDSLATSRGNYISWEWYVGRFGTSIRLGGLEDSNSNAFPRAIVMHRADYATQAHVDRWGKLGRSNGCFAMGPDDFSEALIHLSGGRLLYADSVGIGPNGEQITMPVPPPVSQEAIAPFYNGAATEIEGTP